MKFPPSCRIKELVIIYAILGSFCSFLNWEGAAIRPLIRPGKIPGVENSLDPDQMASLEAR